MRQAFPASAAAAALLLLAGSAAHADCYVKSTHVSNGFGGLGATEGWTETWLSGDKLAERSESNPKNGVLKALTKDSHHHTVTRLDKGLIWEIDDGGKSYTELSFAEMKKRMDESVKKMKKATDRSQKDQAKLPKGQKPDVTVEVHQTGQSRRIAGHDAAETVLTMRVAVADPKGGDAARFRVVVDSWLAADVPCGDDARAFGQKSTVAMGTGMQEGETMLAAALLSTGMSIDDLKSHLDQLQGYPMMTTLSVGMELTPEQEAQLRKAQDQAKAERAKMREKKSEDSGGGLSFGGFGKKLASKALAKAVPEDDSGGDVPELDPGVMFSSTTTVEEVSHRDADASVFEVPAGYELKKR